MQTPIPGANNIDIKEGKFGWANLALIVVVAAVLVFLGFRQGVIKNGSFSIFSWQDPKQLLATAPSSGGAVLGESTYNPDVLNQLKNISFKTTNNNDIASIKNYAQQISTLFVNDAAYDQRLDHQLKFLSDVKQLTVPSVLADYHRVLIGYIQSQSDAQLGLKTYDSTTVQELDQAHSVLKQNLLTSYNINLP